MTRVLILSADIGAGHDLPAELLTDGLRAREPDAEVTIADGLSAMGEIAVTLGRRGVETILRKATFVFEVQYWLIQTFAPTRRLGGWLLALVGGPGLLRLVARVRPDVIVSTYPGTTDVLGRLRRRGKLAVPCVAAVTDLAGLRFWAHPGMDVHLIIHAESRAEVAEIAGDDADIRHVRGLSRPEFDDPPSREAARAALGLPPDGPVVVVSGGGWGVGDLERATRVVLAYPGTTAVCLCGTNTELRARLERAFAGEPRVLVEGFTERMCEWLSAADALVHATAGLTMLEAELCGTWAISYGWGAGHIRVNNAAYRRFGLAAVATTPAELASALEAALAAPRPRPSGVDHWPSAAEAVLELAGAVTAPVGSLGERPH
jgi:processive 1,2-diacylglycerol beta-glucosyltransferase